MTIKQVGTIGREEQCKLIALKVSAGTLERIDELATTLNSSRDEAVNFIVDSFSQCVRLGIVDLGLKKDDKKKEQIAISKVDKSLKETDIEDSKVVEEVEIEELPEHLNLQEVYTYIEKEVYFGFVKKGEAAAKFGITRNQVKELLKDIDAKYVSFKNLGKLCDKDKGKAKNAIEVARRSNKNKSIMYICKLYKVNVNSVKNYIKMIEVDNGNQAVAPAPKKAKAAKDFKNMNKNEKAICMAYVKKHVYNGKMQPSMAAKNLNVVEAVIDQYIMSLKQVEINNSKTTSNKTTENEINKIAEDKTEDVLSSPWDSLWASVEKGPIKEPEYIAPNDEEELFMPKGLLK